jgi:hypothetical protein
MDLYMEEVCLISEKNFGKWCADADSYFAVNGMNPIHQKFTWFKISPLSFDKENTAHCNTNKDDSPDDHIRNIRGSCG